MPPLDPEQSADLIPCHEPSGRDDLESCVREKGHDGKHWFWTGVNVAGGRKSAITLYEQQDERSYKAVAHGDLAGRYDEECAIGLALMIDINANPGKYLSDEENQRYEDAQQSVVDARRHAEREAGRHWIG